MKSRNGFVSNSSSSSFVIWLPDGFDLEVFLDDIDWDKLEDKKENKKLDREKITEAIKEVIMKGRTSLWGIEKPFEAIMEKFIVVAFHNSDQPEARLVVDNDIKAIKDKLACWKDSRPGIGECCCLCRYHFPLMSHPWVDKNPINHQAGWVCTVFATPNVVEQMGGGKLEIVLSNEHGQCELFQERSKRSVEEEYEEA